MKFNESNTVEQMILDAVSGGTKPRMATMNTDKGLKKGVLYPWQSVKSVVINHSKSWFLFLERGKINQALKKELKGFQKEMRNDS